MEDLFLIYVHKIGKNHSGNHMYEFIFSDTLSEVDGPGFDEFPASGKVEPPYDKFIKKVGRLECDLDLEVIQDSSIFCVYDAIDNIIALAWENINDYETYPEKRISFKFGETIAETDKKLYEKDLILNYKIKKHA